jgi:N-methylhydantoinase A
MSITNSETAHLVVGVDVGGTFTDLFVLDERDGSARIVKVPSTRGEEARGFMHGVMRVSDASAPSTGAASTLATIVGTCRFESTYHRPPPAPTTKGLPQSVVGGRQP